MGEFVGFGESGTLPTPGEAGGSGVPPHEKPPMGEENYETNERVSKYTQIKSIIHTNKKQKPMHRRLFADDEDEIDRMDEAAAEAFDEPTASDDDFVVADDVSEAEL